MIQLPIDEVIPELLAALAHAPGAVVQAPPGAGKTTRVPAAILDAGLVNGRVVVLEPRRLAARSVASRLTEERGVELGAEVGYQVRYERVWSKKTDLVVVTEGILGRWLQQDPALEGVGCVVVDEFHERSIHADLAVALLREVQQLRDDLKVVVMSATLGAESIARFLDVPVITSEGRTYPLTIQNVASPPESMESAVVQALESLFSDAEDDGGDVLVFLPGTREIRQAVEAIGARFRGVDVRPLYGALSFEEQQRAIVAGPRRKVVVATNIAETSLTIEGVRAVVDSGEVKRLYASPSTGFDELRTERVSRASATQRAGRAGRVAPGRAVRLWSTHQEFRMQEFEQPEIARVDLTRAVLEVVAWSGGDPLEFDWFERPDRARIERAVSLLQDLGALEGRTRLSARGGRLLELPLHPRLGTMLEVARELGCAPTIAICSAILTEGDFVTGRAQDVPPADSDLLVRAEWLREIFAGREARVVRQGIQFHRGRAERVWRAARELARRTGIDLADEESASRSDQLACLAAGYGDRICFRKGTSWAVAGGDAVVLGRSSLLERAEVFVALEIFGTTRGGEGIARLASRVEAEQLQKIFPHSVIEEKSYRFDGRAEKVQAVAVRSFRGVPFSEQVVPCDANDPGVARLLAHEAARDLERAFRPSRADQGWLERLRYLARCQPELAIPALDASPGGVLEQICWGRRSFSELRRESLVASLQGYLTPHVRRELSQNVPEHWVVPSGSKIRIDYSGEVPVLAVRIQEVFGLAETPRIAGEPVLLHLLAPNRRPAQVTRDLSSFWTNTYPEVRKELRARYPRHPWPEDPLSAPAIRK